jgi:hypothetical protein
MKWRRSWPIVCVVVLAATLFSAPSAAATNWYGKSNRTGCTQGNQADNRAHGIYPYALTSAVNAALNWQVTNVLAPTVVDPVIVSSSNQYTDVIVQDSTFATFCGYTWWPTGSTIGLAVCDTLYEPEGDCEQHHLYILTTWVETQGTTQIRRLVSHEMGHTLGLIHRTDHATPGVMQDGAPWPTASYTSNHDHIHLSLLDT